MHVQSFYHLVNANQLSQHFSSPHLCTSFSDSHYFPVRLLEVVLNLTDALLILFSDRLIYFILYHTYCHILKFIKFFLYNVSFAINFFLQLFHLQTQILSPDVCFMSFYSLNVSTQAYSIFYILDHMKYSYSNFLNDLV